MSVTTFTTVNGRILRQNKDGVVHNFVSDPLGSVVMVRDTSGNTVYEAEYDPYGNVQSETGTNPSSLGYVGTLGYIKDSPTSQYVRARYLLNNLGRWLTKDPLWPTEPGYVYANAAPSMLVDSAGLRPKGKPIFNPDPWNVPGVVDNNNCWSYGCDWRNTNRPPDYEPWEPFKPQPGGDACITNACSCKNVMSCAEKNPRIRPRRSRFCPPGTYTLILFVQSRPPCDYHWIRRDSNGLWSEKCGSLPVGPQFTDPYKQARDNGYDTVCQHYCVTI